MMLRPNNYADFVTVVKELSNKRDVFYFSAVSGASLFFVVHAIPEGRDFVITTGNLGTEPSSFSTDFPTAVRLTTLLSVDT
jgi:hypothetical protein